MSRLCFYTDEDVFSAVASALRAAGFDAVTTADVGRLSEPDDAQIQWAADQGRTIVTFNVRHFAALHGQWMRHSQHHSGIIVSSQYSVGVVMRRILNLARTLDAGEMKDRLEFLSDW